MTIAERSLKKKTMLGGEIFWQTHLLVPVAESIGNPKRANYSVEVRILPQQQFLSRPHLKDSAGKPGLELLKCRMVKFLADTPPCRGGGDYGKLSAMRITTLWRFDSFSYSSSHNLGL